MPVATQAKLLRVLEDSCVRRLGGKSEMAVDVRVIAATNKVLEEALRKGELREDLYYRLNVFQIPLPPMRQREGDLGVLTEALIQMLNRKHENARGGRQCRSARAAQALFLAGNVRELRNVLERAVILAGEGTITKHHLPRDFGVPAGARQLLPELEPDVVRLRWAPRWERLRRLSSQATLQHTRNNKTRAAEILGISLKNSFQQAQGVRLGRGRGWHGYLDVLEVPASASHRCARRAGGGSDVAAVSVGFHAGVLCRSIGSGRSGGRAVQAVPGESSQPGDRQTQPPARFGDRLGETPGRPLSATVRMSPKC